MNETETIIHVGKIMLENKVITEFGLRILHNDFLADIAHPIEPNELKKATRICVFMTIVFNMTLLYGGYCQANNFSMEHYEMLQPIALHFEKTLPKLLKTLSNKYLEIYHGLKVNAFVHGHKFETYMPTHPEDQKVLDEIGYEEGTPAVEINV
jgi:hypothetical protein